MENSVERQAIIDQEQLRLLSLFYYIAGIITLVVSIFVGIYFMILSFVFRNPEVMEKMAQSSAQEMPANIMGILMVVFGIIVVFVLLLGVAQILTGNFIKNRKGKAFSYIIAALSCLSIPYGTILGICTFIVLGRSSVRQMYNGSSLPESTSV